MLKIVSFLPVVYASCGNITLTDFIIQAADNVDNSTHVLGDIVHKRPASCKACGDVEITESQSLILIARYVGCKLQQKIVCEIFEHELVDDQ